MADKQRIKYQSRDGFVVILEVPWGDGSGNIPPPLITFTTTMAGGVYQFAYQGEED